MTTKSMGYTLITDKGNVATGEADNIWIPRTIKSTTPVILVHGAATPEMWTVAGWSVACAFAARLANSGYVCVAGAFGSPSTVSDPYCNDTHMARITSARAYAASKVPGMSSTRMHGLGVSMGGGALFRYAVLNPANVASIVCMIPFCNPNQNYQTDIPAGIRAGIESAWGITYPAAIPSQLDLPSIVPAIKNVVPSKVLYSTVDPYIRPQDAIAIATAAGSEIKAIDSTYGHTNLGVGGANFETDILGFFQAHV